MLLLFRILSVESVPDMMLDIVLNEKIIKWVFIILAVVTPVGSTGFFLLRKRKSLSPITTLWLIIIGVAGPLNLVLWHLYNLVENTFGLDSVKALLINLLVFIVLALIAGFVLSRVYTRLSLSYTPPEHPDESYYNTNQTS